MHSPNTTSSSSFYTLGLFETDAILIPKTRCDYKFESLPAVTLNGNSSQHHQFSLMQQPQHHGNSNRGRFYSPQYPSTYPKSAQCAYIFIGQPNERVKLVFEHIRLQKSDLR